MEYKAPCRYDHLASGLQAVLSYTAYAHAIYSLEDSPPLLDSCG